MTEAAQAVAGVTSLDEGLIEYEDSLAASLELLLLEAVKVRQRSAP